MGQNSDSSEREYQRIIKKFPSLKPYKDSKRMVVLLDQVGAKETEFKKVLKDEGVTDLWIPLEHKFGRFFLEPGSLSKWRKQQSDLLSTTFDFEPSPGLKSIPPHYNLSSTSCGDLGYPSNLDIGDTLGTTKSAAVVQVSVKGKEKVPLAQKIIYRKHELQEETKQMRRILGEIRALKKLRHRHYVQLIASYTTEQQVGIVMSPVADCDLHSFLESFESMKALSSLKDFKALQDKQNQLARFFGCLAQAVANLHCRYGIRHRDIKPKNILVRGDQVLLADFGIALDWSDTGETTTYSKEGMKDPAYCAPEVYHGKRKGTKSDIWSLGCVFLEMALVLEGLPRDDVKETLNRGFYWEDIGAIQDRIKEIQRFRSQWNHEPLEWVQNMVREDRDSRWKAADVVRAVIESPLQRFAAHCCHVWREPELSEDEDLQEYRDEEEIEQFAFIYDQFSRHVKVRMIEDSKYFSNWISSKIVDRYKMETWSTKSSRKIEVDKHTIHSKRLVRLDWRKPGGPTREEEFFVAELPDTIEMIVGVDI
ncbi:hypothetical protein PFICI_04378 [Pestalotiopsis fici W106-1]|uniref:Protein kinase domain-containing protein n=1 Tax=Pestalotiopsis fici (strain W106-1 / CGMCC3.15140) TaxID=1229662 RepID=W3XAP7_PESFW|nr:uncharacterized protein PFICI_04378 [Pestalotiopsis fici W106-1]ETS82502.1 hypothetical protein PFICI_04378 [Pestalotiopsis fici W106-1]